MNLYSIGKPIVNVFYHLCFHIEVEGVENIPERGAVLICCNHRSNFDPPLVGVSMARDLSFVAKAELFRFRLIGWVFHQVHAFPIKRGTGDRGAIRLAVNLLRAGHALLIFPEGTRNHTGQLKKGLSGAGFFALNTDAVVIPCAIIGKYKFRSRLIVRFGKPIDSTEWKARRMKAAEASSIIMDHIGQLLGE
ncbi:MAG: lysophospholipid acyltransferase family protein [Sporolactobacillus sp.]